jgi:hypothetical protein
MARDFDALVEKNLARGKFFAGPVAEFGAKSCAVSFSRPAVENIIR